MIQFTAPPPSSTAHGTRQGSKRSLLLPVLESQAGLCQDNVLLEAAGWAFECFGPQAIQPHSHPGPWREAESKLMERAGEGEAEGRRGARREALPAAAATSPLCIPAPFADLLNREPIPT